MRTPASVLVKIGARSVACEVKEPGTCDYCHSPVIWCETPRAERTPLEIFTADDTHTELHLPNCGKYRRQRARAGR